MMPTPLDPATARQATRTRRAARRLPISLAALALLVAPSATNLAYAEGSAGLCADGSVPKPGAGCIQVRADDPGTPAPTPPPGDSRESSVDRVVLPRVCHTADGGEISCGTLDATRGCVIGMVVDEMTAVQSLLGNPNPPTRLADEACLRQVDDAAPAPEVVARSAVAQMNLEAGELQVNPVGPGLVGMNTWMWQAPGPSTTGPQTVSVSAGATTVTATARVTGLTISTGEDTVTCHGPGTVYDKKYLNLGDPTKDVESPTCGYTYRHPSNTQRGGVYTLNVTVHWQVTWTSTTGQSGTIPADLQSTRTYEVTEIQALIQDHNEKDG